MRVFFWGQNSFDLNTWINAVWRIKLNSKCKIGAYEHWPKHFIIECTQLGTTFIYIVTKTAGCMDLYVHWMKNLFMCNDFVFFILSMEYIQAAIRNLTFECEKEEIYESNLSFPFTFRSFSLWFISFSSFASSSFLNDKFDLLERLWKKTKKKTVVDANDFKYHMNKFCSRLFVIVCSFASRWSRVNSTIHRK